MRVESFRDLQQIPAFSGMTEIQMLHPSNDMEMRNALQQLGFDIHEPIRYVANKHRDRRGNIGVGFRAVGHIDPNNREYLNSKLADNYDRMAAAGREGDYSLASELASLMGVGSPMRMLEEDAFGTLEILEDTELKQEGWWEADREMIEQQIAALTDILHNIRPEKLNEFGEPPLLGEYHEEGFIVVKTKVNTDNDCQESN